MTEPDISPENLREKLGSTPARLAELLEQSSSASSEEFKMQLLRENWREALSLMVRSCATVEYQMHKKVPNSIFDLISDMAGLNQILAIVDDHVVLLADGDIASREETAKVIEDTIAECEREIREFGEVLGFEKKFPVETQA